MNLPTHPESDDGDPAPPTGETVVVRVVIVVVIALLVGVILLHLTGVMSPGSH